MLYCDSKDSVAKKKMSKKRLGNARPRAAPIDANDADASRLTPAHYKVSGAPHAAGNQAAGEARTEEDPPRPGMQRQPRVPRRALVEEGDDERRAVRRTADQKGAVAVFRCGTRMHAMTGGVALGEVLSGVSTQRTAYRPTCPTRG